ALEQVVERKRPVMRHHDFAIDGEVAGFDVEDGLDQFGKIACQRAARFRLQIDLSPMAKYQTAKPIPFRLILPAASGRDLVDRKRLHGWERRAHGSFTLGAGRGPSTPPGVLWRPPKGHIQIRIRMGKTSNHT